MTGDTNVEKGEPLRECIYCGDLHPGRGMYNHVRWTSDEGHGERGDVPEEFAVSDCKVVGEVEIAMNKEEGYQKDHARRVCNYCGKPCVGKSGLGVHLSRQSGNGLHPEIEHKSEINYDQHMEFPATEDGEILVPREKYADLISLTDEEEEAGFEIRVDTELVPVGEAIATGPKVDPEEVLEEVRQELKRYMKSGQDISPVEAYKLFESQMKPTPV